MYKNNTLQMEVLAYNKSRNKSSKTVTNNYYKFKLSSLRVNR